MSIVVGHPFAAIFGSTLTLSYIDADDSISPAGRAYSDIDIGPLTIVGSLAIALFLGRPFGAAIAFLLKVIGYSARLIPELETDEVSYEGGVDDRLSNHDPIATNCLGLWR